MSLQTPFTEMLSVTHPIVLAPMGSQSGGALAAAVSNAGGLGLVGGGPGLDRGRLAREVGLVTERTTRPWGIGFITWIVKEEVVAWALEQGPAAVMLSFGDPGKLASRIRRAGTTLIIQVTSLDEARQAIDAGADVIVAQGSEAGGHGGRRGTLPFVPAVVDLVGPVPVLAAGGIADGRGLAAALVLGASGALIGTRFVASSESLASPAVAKALVEGHGEETESSRIHDIAAGVPWPRQYPGRSIKNVFGDRWRGREEELAASPEALQSYREAVAAGDPHAVPVWAGEDIDLIHDIEPAAAIVETLASDAERALAQAARPG
jgi:nitronate monooxygenase